MNGDKGFLLMSFLDDLEEPLSMSNFTSRLLLQKKMFILEYLGSSLKFDFGWYLRGPYSTELTRTAYSMEKLYSNREKRKNILNEVLGNDKDVINKAKKVFTELNKLGENKEYWYELVASLLFLKKFGYPKPKNEKQLLKLLEEKKKKFSKDDTKKAIDYINNLIKIKP